MRGRYVREMMGPAHAFVICVCRVAAGSWRRLAESKVISNKAEGGFAIYRHALQQNKEIMPEHARWAPSDGSRLSILLESDSKRKRRGGRAWDIVASHLGVSSKQKHTVNVKRLKLNL